MPVKMMIIGNIARKKRIIEFNRFSAPASVSYTIT